MRRILICLFTLPLAGLLPALYAQTSVPTTTTTLAVSPSGSVPFEQLVTLTAAVTDGTGNAVVHGTVTFHDGAVTLGTSYIISNSSAGFTPGTAIFRTRSLAQGSHSFTATFDGNPTDQQSVSGTQGLTITAPAGPYASVTTLAATAEYDSLNMPTGQYTMDATIDGFGPFAPTGSIDLNDTSVNQTLGTQPLSPGSLGLVTSPSPLAACSGAIASGDFNNDGNLDVVAFCETSGSYGILTMLGDGRGGFTPATSSTSLGTTTPPAQIVVGDFNGDGNLDVAVLVQPSGDGGSVFVLLGNGDGTFQPSVKVANTGPFAALAAADFNNDGYTDLAIASQGTAGLTLTILPGQANGSFGTAVSTTVTLPQSLGEAGGGPTVLVAGDLNHDGNTDLAIALGDGVIVLLGKGDGTFQTASFVQDGDQPEPGGSGPCYCGQNGTSIALADLGGTGDLDIIIGSQGDKADGGSLQSQVSVLSGNGTGSFPTYTTFLLPNVTQSGQKVSPAPLVLAVGDFTYTGSPGVLAFTDQGNYLLPGNGSGSLQQEQPATGPTIAGINQAAAGDFTSNGNFDVLTLSTLLQPAFLSTAELTQVTVPGQGVQQQVAASYSGDSNFAASTSNAVTVLSTISDTVSLTSNLPGSLQAFPGASVQLTATVTVVGNSASPTGTIQFYDGSTPIGAPVTVLNAAASYTSTAFAVGSHSITAQYSGDSNFPAATSSATAFSVVSTGTSAVSFTVPPAAQEFPDATFNVVIQVQGSPAVLGPAPSGTVSLIDNGVTVATGSLGTDGNATIPLNSVTNNLPLGANSLSISYPGDSLWSSSTSAAVNFTISQAQISVLDFACQPDSPQNPGTTLTCSASLQNASGGNPPMPTGTLSLVDASNNDAVVATDFIAPGSFPIALAFQANTLANPLPAGNHLLQISWAGDTTWASFTSTTVPITINAVTPTFTLTSSLGGYGSVVEGTAVTFTATASGSVGTPTGTVQFYVDGTAAGSPVTISSGVATYQTSSLGPGQHSITAAYSGNSYYGATTTNGVVTVVTQGGDSIAIALPGSASVALGTPITVNGTLTVVALGPAPSGSVTLLDGTAPVATATLSGNQVSFMVNTASAPLAVGAHSFSLQYGGSTLWVASASATAGVTVTQATTTTGLTSSAATVSTGTSVTFTANVSSGVTSPAPTGTVQFYDGSAALGSAVTLTGGSATYATSALAAGSHSITAVYSGDANFASSTSTALSETVQAIGLQSGTQSQSVSPGGSATYTLTITGQGENAATTFACSGLPTGAACSFNPSTVTGSGTTTMTITTTGSQAMTHPDLKLFTHGGGALFACVLLLIVPRRRRKLWLSVILIAFLPVLAVGCGGGNSGGGGGGGTPAGTYTITVTATAGSGTSALTQSTTVTLVVE